MTRKLVFPILLLVLAVASAAFAAEGGGGEKESAMARHPALLDPSKAVDQAPDLFRVKLATTKGDVILEIHRDWAPKGADRFYNLVKTGYLDDIAFFRAIAGFMVQFGIHGDPEVTAAWRAARITDDAVKQSNTRGMITFATAGPNTRTTQLFINLANNARLDGQGFSPFGKVVEGMEVIDALYTGYGEGQPQGRGPSQQVLMQTGNTYLKKHFPELDYIKTATVVE